MGRIQSFVGICLLALIVVGVACAGQTRPGGPTQQSPIATTTAGETMPTTTPTALVSGAEKTDTAAEKNPTPKRDSGTMPELGIPEGRPLPERVPFSEEMMTTGEVPEKLLQDIIQDLVERTGAAPQSIELQRAEAVVWRDGSLGCPKPGMMYTQALVDGYWVVLGYDGEAYDYRANSGGYFVLCEVSLSQRSGPLDSSGSEPPTQ